MKVSEVMTTRVAVIEADESIGEAAFTMKETDSKCLVVMNGRKVAGVLTERTLVLGCLLESHSSWCCRVYRHMQAQTDCVQTNMDLDDALALMKEKGLDYIPVLERGNPVGLLSYEWAIAMADFKFIRTPVA